MLSYSFLQTETLRSCVCRGNICMQHWVSCCRHVSVTMKNYRPEMVLGATPQSPVTEGGLAIRVGSFSGKPITPKSRRGVSNLGPAGGSPEPSGNKSKATFSKVCNAVKCSQCSSGAWHPILTTFPSPPTISLHHTDAAAVPHSAAIWHMIVRSCSLCWIHGSQCRERGNT